MDNKIKILLDKINIDEASYQYFNDAVITKIKINSKTNNWNIFITKTLGGIICGEKLRRLIMISY